MSSIIFGDFPFEVMSKITLDDKRGAPPPRQRKNETNEHWLERFVKWSMETTSEYELYLVEKYSKP